MAEALRQSEEKFRLLFEYSAEPMLVLDGESLLFLECNEAALKMIGAASMDAVVNKSPVDISPERQPDGQLSSEKAGEILRRVAVERTMRFEWVHLREDGAEFFVEAVLTNMEIDRMRRVFVTWRDIGERKEAQAQIERTLSLQNATIESTADGILVVDHQGRVTTFNQRFAEMWRLPKDALAPLDGRQMIEWTLGQLTDPETFVARIRELESHHDLESFDLLPLKDGRIVERFSRPQRLGSTTVGRVWSFRDVTEQRRAEASILELNATLERRVEQRTAELQQMQVDLEKALALEKDLAALKTNFVAMVSHEFRTPLGVISVSSEVLTRYFDRLQPEQRSEHLGAIVQNVRRMSRMMEDVLLLSRVDAGRMEFDSTPVDLDDFCRKLVEEVHSATNRACLIEVLCDPEAKLPARADESLLRHILTNLLSNAVKYSPACTPVSLHISRKEDSAVFVVADQGMGIPSEDQERLFSSFHRAKNTEHIHGTGLGLVIVKRCCDLHEGKISLHSVLGKGTTFTVQLPLFISDSPSPRPASIP